MALGTSSWPPVHLPSSFNCTPQRNETVGAESKRVIDGILKPCRRYSREHTYITSIVSYDAVVVPCRCRWGNRNKDFKQIDSGGGGVWYFEVHHRRPIQDADGIIILNNLHLRTDRPTGRTTRVFQSRRGVFPAAPCPRTQFPAGIDNETCQAPSIIRRGWSHRREEGWAGPTPDLFRYFPLSSNNNGRKKKSVSVQIAPLLKNFGELQRLTNKNQEPDYNL